MKISYKLFRRLTIFLPVLLATAILNLSIAAQTNSVDTTFNVVPDRNSILAPNFVVQPDNKIIVFGNFQAVNGTVKNQIARFNQDGSLDNSFDCTICSITNLTNVLAQPDGKIFVSGAINNNLQAVVYRLNPDGSRDASFNSPFAAIPPNASSATNSAIIEAVQPDGKVLVTLYSTNSGSFSAVLNRLNGDGSNDATFTPVNVGGGRLIRTTPQKIALQPDGKILVATNTTSGGGSAADIRRYNSNGTADTTFEPPSIIGDGGTTNGFPRSLIYDFDVQPDGSLIIVGDFITVNAVSRLDIAKLLPAGNVDASFNNTNFNGANRVRVLSSSKILIGTPNRIYRLNADGSTDNSFAAPTNLTQINRLTIDAAGGIVVFGAFTENSVSVNRFARFNQDGSVESSFAPNFGIAGSVVAIGAQADGKVIFAGDFVRVNGVPRQSFARVNADGTLDQTFAAGIFTGAVSKIIVQPDGKILIAGTFSSYNGTTRFGITRLNQDGSLDQNFTIFMTFVNAGSAEIRAIALQPDGKILVGGNFNTVDGQARTGIARLNADGRLDTSFNPTFGNPSIANIVVQADGKIFVGGTFSGVNGFSRSNLARLNADGTLDDSFNVGSNFYGGGRIEIQADGKYLVSGGNGIARLNDNGTTDTTFSPPSLFQSANANSSPLVFLAQPDGSILVGGTFSQLGSVPRFNFVRLRPTGALDTSFFPTGANNAVRTIVRQANGQILIGGDFSVIGGVLRLSIARLNVAAYRPITPYDFDGDGRADVAVFRPSNGNWYVLPSQTGNFYGFPFGQAGDQIAPADYDNDGKTDIAVFRENVAGAGDKAYFYILNSSDGSFRPVQFGTQGDVPVPGDWDGDGKTDIAVYRAAAAGGQSYFFYRPSAQPTVEYATIAFGAAGDKPIPADYDGDGRLDPAVFQAGSGGTGLWRILYSSLNQVGQTFFGLSSDIPTPVDFDGDGKANIAVFRPSNGTWYTSQNSQNNYGAIQFGAAGDLPIPADYDGDGRADVAVFRPSNGAWYLNRSTSGFTGVQFGASGDKPAPNAFVR